MLRKITLAAATLFSATAVKAGTLTEPVIEEVVEMTEKGSSSTGLLIPLLILGAVAALIASNGDDDEVAPTATNL